MFISLFFKAGGRTMYQCEKFTLLPGPEDGSEFLIEMKTPSETKVHKFDRGDVTIYIMNDEGKTIDKLFDDRHD